MTRRSSTKRFARISVFATLAMVLFSLGPNRALACDPDDPVCGDNLGCNDQINVTLKDGCAAIITPDMVLEGNLACLSDFQRYFKIRIVGDDADETNEGYGETTVDACGRFIYEILFDHDAFCADNHKFKVNFPAEGCWGYINAEDKTPPQFVCTETTIEEVEVEVNAQEYSGQTSAPDVRFGDYSCFRDVGVSTVDCQRGYKRIENVSSNEDAVYTFQLDMPGAPGAIAIYEGDFDPQNPCANIVAQSSTTYQGTATTTDGLIRISLPMRSAAIYTVLVTTDDDACSSNENFVLTAYPDQADARLTGFGSIFQETVAYPLLCGDIGRVQNSDALIEAPEIIENCETCGPVETWFEDVVTQNGDCGGTIITRTWYARDASGNEARSCTQTIKFRNTRLTDVIRPPTTVPIECDATYPVDEEGNPHPDFTGYPFVLTASGIVDLNQAYCNVGASYRDISRIDVCEGIYKIVREWTIIDWCYIPGQYDLNNSPTFNYRQIIKIGDFSGPQIDGAGDETPSFPTGPFGCEATFKVPDVSISDNCSNYTVRAEVFIAVKQPVYDKYGRLIDERYEHVFFREADANGYVYGVPINDPGYPHLIVYYAEDGCGNKSRAETFFEVKDEIEPIAVCNDDLNISIGGEGIGRITANDVNEGSWDNCALDTVLISRKLIDADRREAYLQQVYGLTLADLEIGDVEDLSGRGREVWVLKSNPEKPVLLFERDSWYTWWANDLWFICEDMGGEVTIELLARDISLNTNVCWLNVLVEDKIAPYCIPPEEVRMACTELPPGFDPEDDAQLEALFGMAGATDNCPGSTARQTRKTVENWDCNSGLITRYFLAEDAKGRLSSNSCKQVIDIYRVHEYEIRFPADADADCGVPSPDTIDTYEIACDLLAVNVQDEEFTASGDACYKIRRTFKVINWCEYDGESDPVIVGRNEDCDGETGEEDVYVLVRPNGVTYFDRDNNESANPGSSPCGNGAEGHLTNSLINEAIVSNGYWQYTQFIKVYDRQAPEVTFGGDDQFCSIGVDCDAVVTIPLQVEDVCAGPDVDVEVFLLPDEMTGLGPLLDLQDPDNAAATEFVLGGAYPNFSISARLPIGDHAFEVRVVDGCGNSTVKTIDFSVFDCKAPSPICINGLAVELMPVEAGTDVDGDGDEDAGAMTLAASDFKISGLEDCSPEVTLSINRQGDTPDRDQASIILTCDDPDTLMVEIYAWDSANNPTAVQPDGTLGGPNYDHCLTYVLVQDNMFNLCSPASPAGVSGLIMTDERETVENVEVRLSGGMETNVMTAVDGFYAFTGLETNTDYTVAPLRDDTPINGVTTFDLVLITKHILGTRRLDSPYKIIAADANGSGSVSAFDLIHIRKLILSVYRELPNSPSWRFVPASYRFPVGTNPWAEAFPEVLNYNDIQEQVANGDFIGIKIGDVNYSAAPNSMAVQERSVAGVFYLETDEREVRAGQTYRVAFRAAEEEVIQGYQFTMQYEGLELLDIEFGVARAENLAVLEEGVITASWNQGQAEGENGKAELFTLVVRATTNGLLSELVSVNSRYTPAEAYNTADELLDIGLSFGHPVNQAGAPDLYQNTPNPFREETLIGFMLPEATQATLKIHDLNGRVLKVIRGEYGAGDHQVRLRRTELGAGAGVLYYTLETDRFSATKRMVLVGE